MSAGKVIHVVPGNSENRLVLAMAAKSDNSTSIISLFGPDDETRKSCSKENIPYRCLNLENASFLKRNQFLLRTFAFDFLDSTVFLHSFEVYRNFFLLCLRKSLRERLVPVRHHNMLHIMQGNKLLLIFEKSLFALFKRWVAVSNTVSKQMINEGCKEEKIGVIRNALPKPVSVTSIPYGVLEHKKALRILSVGRISWEKNQTAQLRIASLLKKENILFSLEMYGSGEGKIYNELCQGIESLGLDSCVSLNDYVTDLSKYFNSFDLLLHTSVDEACPLVIIEALLVGLPIVSSNAGGCGEILKDYYPTYQPNDVNAFLQRIKYINENMDTSIEFARKIARLAALDFSVSKMQLSYEEIALATRFVS